MNNKTKDYLTLNNLQEIGYEYLKREQQQKIERYRILNQDIQKGQILFTGSSLMEQFPINELLMTKSLDNIIYNRGIGGFTTNDMLNNMDIQIFDIAPSKIFINIGTNDIAYAGAPFKDLLSYMVKNYSLILEEIKTKLPNTRVYLMAYFPVNEVDITSDEDFDENRFINRNNHNLSIANEEIQKLALQFNYEYIDANKGLTDNRGLLRKEFTLEGIHIYANGYRIILENLKPYI